MKHVMSVKKNIVKKIDNAKLILNTRRDWWL